MSLGVLTILDWDLTLWHRTRGRMMAMQRRTRARKRERGVEYNVREYDGGDPGRKVSLHWINAE
ncbi:hypothetical protein ALC53_05088 [Atta colombica]|uniref:Uncharacterized protein n=1 Tax=Atta colombica TaxID=520822 RepID=A0A151I506_9HYME|nr:hypothetical protein ALC53_05088 [Atta colombica]